MQKQSRVKKQSKTLLKHRLEILEAAHSIFLELGIGKTTIREIAHKVKMTKRTIFNYFETKDILAEELQIHLIRKMSSSYIVNFSEGINELSKIRTFLDGFLYSSQESIKMIQYIAAFDNYYIHGYPTSNTAWKLLKSWNHFINLFLYLSRGKKKELFAVFRLLNL
jgi:AcrR family transcriptional regulator